MRYSKQRDAIAEIVKSTKCHPDAEWIYSNAKRLIPNISLGTVYRNLKSLAASGELLTLETELGALHYDGDTSEHSHFICSDCGAIIDLFIKSGLCEQLVQMGLRPQCEKTVIYVKCTCKDVVCGGGGGI